MDKQLLRIIDANYNRAKEALRVVEDIFRFSWEDKGLTRKIKAARHSLTDHFKSKRIFQSMLAHRDAKGDIARAADALEVNRKNIEDILYANFQRAKESVRVLEEACKIVNKKKTSSLKRLRYSLYSLEKNANKGAALHNH